MARCRQHLNKQHARAEVACVARAEKRRALIIIFFKFTPLTIRKERFESFLAGVKINVVFFDADKIESQTGARLTGATATHEGIADRPRVVWQDAEKILQQLDRLFCRVVAVFHLRWRLFKIAVGVFVRRRAVKRSPNDELALIFKNSFIRPAILFVPRDNPSKPDRRHLKDNRVYGDLSPIAKDEDIPRRI